MSIVERFHAVSVAVTLAAAMQIFSTAAATPPTAVSLHNCSEQSVALIYPAILYRKLLPPGFRFPGLGLTARILVSGSNCESANGGGPSSELLSFMEVTPTAEYTDPIVQLYAIALTGYSTRPDTVAAFAAAGFADLIHLGTVQITEVDHPRLHERQGYVIAGDSDGKVITTTTVFGPITTVVASRTRLFAVRGGAVVGIADGEYTAHPGYGGIGILLKFGDGPSVAPADASVATQESGYDLLITPVPLPVPLVP
ncbi:MAG: hypothetical protein JWR16_1263 [Nevskia sp.]|nr:hypothetical protein [Nevskia sp.]